MGTVKFQCKQCLQEIEFEVGGVVPVGGAPVPLENIHGNPPHKLIIFVSSSLEGSYQVDSFRIDDVDDGTDEKPVEFSPITREVLNAIHLDEQEIEFYFSCSAKGPSDETRLARAAQIPVSLAREMAQKFVQKGLFVQKPGDPPLYEALPPYAAIHSGLNEFEDFITALKVSTPLELENSFRQFEQTAAGLKNLRDYSGFLKTIRNQVESKISQERAALDENLSKMMDQDRSINALNSLYQHSISVIEQQFGNLEERFHALGDRITSNLKKLRLGVVLKPVEEITTKVIQGEIDAVKSRFKNEFVTNIQNLVKQFVDQLSGVVTDAGSISDNLRKIFETISSDFDSTLSQATANIESISDSVSNSFKDIRETFTEKVVASIDDVLEKIINRLQLSNLSVQDFWNQAKKARRSSMNDVWFIPNAKAMDSQISESVSLAKMRVLIVAPTLAHVSTTPLLNTPTHINIRVCCFVDETNPEHRSRLSELVGRRNITVRNRELINLWGINLDYEEVIVGIVSGMGSKPAQGEIQVVGIGSILDEHIKIFVPILEDAWMGAKKYDYDDLATMPASTKSYPPISSPVVVPPLGTPSRIQQTPKINPGSVSVESRTTISAPEFPLEIDASKNAESLPSPIESHIGSGTVSVLSQEEIPPENREILDKIAVIEKNVNNPKSIVDEFFVLADLVKLVSGEMAIFKDIKTWGQDLKSRPVLDDFKRKMLLKRLQKWREEFSR